MSLARAFTMRASKRDTSSTPPLPIRTGSVKVPGKAIDRNLISHPVALLSTTNMLSYNAPDISSLKSLRKASSSVSSGSSHASADDSDESSPGNGSRNSQTDSSSVDNSPTTSTKNDVFSIKFRNSTPRRSISTSNLRNRTPSSPSPEIPHRAPSHSKKAHERVARKSASQQFQSHSNTHSWLSVPTARERRTSLEILSNNHTFGKELKQLDEVAEEFNDTIEDIDREADADVIKKKNLGKFCAEEYLAEIRPLYLRCFEPKLLTVGPGGWI